MNLAQFHFLLEEDAPESAFSLLRQNCASLVIDLCGFTRRVEDHGLFPTLREINQLHRVAARVIVRHGGRRIKYDADNVFGVFPTVGAARAAAMDLHAELPANIQASVGIGWGDTYVLEDDFFGLEVNRASLLGEDEADTGETLMSEAALEQLGQEIAACKGVTVEI